MHPADPASWVAPGGGSRGGGRGTAVARAADTLDDGIQQEVRSGWREGGGRSKGKRWPAADLERGGGGAAAEVGGGTENEEERDGCSWVREGGRLPNLEGGVHI